MSNPAPSFFPTGRPALDDDLARSWVAAMRDRGCCFHLVLSLNSDVPLSGADQAVFNGLYAHIVRAVVLDPESLAHAMLDAEVQEEGPGATDAPLGPDHMPVNPEVLDTLRRRLAPGTRYEMVDHSDGITELMMGIRTVIGTGTAGSKASLPDGRRAWIPLDGVGAFVITRCAVTQSGFLLDYYYPETGKLVTMTYAWR